MITDMLASYGAAKREIMPGIEHRQHKGLNNRAEARVCRPGIPGAAVPSVMIRPVSLSAPLPSFGVPAKVVPAGPGTRRTDGSNSSSSSGESANFWFGGHHPRATAAVVAPTDARCRRAPARVVGSSC